MQMFERAIALDPAFALAHAGLATVCGLFYLWHEKDKRWIEKGHAACDRALALDPQLAEAYAGRASLFWAELKYDGAIQYARLAVERKPDCEGAYWVLGQALFASDRWQEAAALAERAIAVSGDDYNVYIPYGNVFERLGQTEAARNIRRQEVAALERHLERVPEDVRARILLSSTHAFFGQAAEAARELQKAVALRPDDPNILYNAACTYAKLQNKAEALAMLARAKKSGWSNFDWGARDPDLASLREDPEFLRLLERGGPTA